MRTVAETLVTNTRLAAKMMINNHHKDLIPSHIDQQTFFTIIDELEQNCYSRIFENFSNETKTSVDSKINMYKSLITLTCDKITPLFINRLRSMFIDRLSNINTTNVTAPDTTNVTTPGIDNQPPDQYISQSTNQSINQPPDQQSVLRVCIAEIIRMPTYEFHEDLKKYADHTMELSSIEYTCSITIYTCPKCRERDQKIEKKQTASIDEAETIIATCNQCGNVWRVF